MRALVTGATGFMGRRLVERLAADGQTIGQVTRQATAVEGHFFLGAGEVGDFERILDAFSPDVVFHLAGRTSGSALDLFLANTVLASNLLRAVERLPTPPVVVLAGSAAEYGPVAAEDLPVGEGHPCRPVSDYGVSKHAQTLAGLAWSQMGVPVLVARIFNLLGPGMPRHLALQNFATQMLTADSLRVGDLDVERDFIGVDEAVRLVVALAACAGARGQIINICSGVTFKLRDLVETMIRQSGRSIEIVADPLRMRGNDIRKFVGATDRIRSFGLVPCPPDMDHLLESMLIDAGVLTERTS